jgi:hypothetical protein
MLPPFVNISQARTEKILDACAPASPYVDVRWGHEVAEIAQDTDGATLTCSNGARVRASYVLACAGARAGALRDSLGVAFPGRAFGDRFLIRDVRADLPGWAPDRLLDSYDTERRAAARENLDVTTATMRFLVPQSVEERRLRRDVLEAAARDPAAMAAVDSGRFAEPFWYLDSPLTTPEPTRPFTGRPARGRDPDPAPGVIVADAAVRVPGHPRVRRLREVLRDGLTLLHRGDAGADRLMACARRATRGPVTALDVDLIDTDGSLRGALRTGEVWLVRPDAHLAATLPDPAPEALTAAVRRATGAG